MIAKLREIQTDIREIREQLKYTRENHSTMDIYSKPYGCLTNMVSAFLMTLP